MERPLKQSKVEKLLAIYGHLNSKDVWIEILTANPSLSIDDILKMCSLNSYFKFICDSNQIWEKLIQKQFGQDDYLKVKKLSEGPIDLYVLFAWRAFKTKRHNDLGKSGYGWPVFWSYTGTILVNYDPEKTQLKITTTPHFISSEENTRMSDLVLIFATDNELVVNPGYNITIIKTDSLNVVFKFILYITRKGFKFIGEDREYQTLGDNVCSQCHLKFEKLFTLENRKDLGVFCGKKCARILFESVS